MVGMLFFLCVGVVGGIGFWFWFVVCVGLFVVVCCDGWLVW